MIITLNSETIEADWAIHNTIKDLIVFGDEVDVGEWHAQDVSGIEHAISFEILNAGFTCAIPEDMDTLAALVHPNLPWAEEHFQERVSGQPLNPPPSHVNWPWASANEKHQTQEGEAFSHSYPERFWPKHAGTLGDGIDGLEDNKGLRFTLGDLNDVVQMLAKSPYTRQAYLPVWFPEDTGAVAGERVPCSLGYHFILRDGKLHCVYYIRSCDAVRYFRDDVYLACRLTQWIIEQLRKGATSGAWRDGVEPGTLTMHITSFHCFKGDLPKLRREYG